MSEVTEITSSLNNWTALICQSQLSSVPDTHLDSHHFVIEQTVLELHLHRLALVRVRCFQTSAGCRVSIQAALHPVSRSSFIRAGILNLTLTLICVI